MPRTEAAKGIESSSSHESEAMTTDRELLGLASAPKLAELKSRPCSLAELQAAMVNLIELYNAQGEAMNAAINRKQDREWRATL